MFFVSIKTSEKSYEANYFCTCRHTVSVELVFRFHQPMRLKSAKTLTASGTTVMIAVSQCQEIEGHDIK